MPTSRIILLSTVLAILSLAVVLRFSLSSDAATGPRTVSTSTLHEQAMDASLSMVHRESAVAQLATRDSQGVAAVRQVLASVHEPALRAQCLRVLSDVGDDQSVDAMISGLSDGSPQVREAANTAMSRMLGGVQITVQTSPQGPTAADLERQAAFVRKLYEAQRQQTR